MLNDPSLSTKVANAAEKTSPQQEPTMVGADNAPLKATANNAANNNAMLAQVVGVIIGSPEFQRK